MLTISCIFIGGLLLQGLRILFDFFITRMDSYYSQADQIKSEQMAHVKALGISTEPRASSNNSVPRFALDHPESNSKQFSKGKVVYMPAEFYQTA